MDEINHSKRAHALLSASSSARWIACPASARLAARYPSTDTVFTREGTQAHEVAEMCARARIYGEAVPLTEDLDADMLRHGQAYADYISELCEVSTSCLLEQRVDFSRWVPQGFGTADCILLNGDTMDVIDYKYGQGVEVDAVQNPQMMLYGLGALSEYGFVYDVTKIRLHIFQPRRDHISTYELSDGQLLAFGAEVRVAAQKALDDEHIELRAGKHCKFCPHAGRCSELARQCLEDISQDGSITPEPGTLSAEAVSAMLDREPIISAWLKKLKSEALTALQNGKAIPGYKVVEGKLGDRKWTDEAKIREALNSAGISEAEYTTTQLLSPAAMDKALGKKRAKELLEQYISRTPGAPTVVKETDKRPALDRKAEAIADFSEDVKDDI